MGASCICSCSVGVLVYVAAVVQGLLVYVVLLVVVWGPRHS